MRAATNAIVCLPVLHRQVGLTTLSIAGGFIVGWHFRLQLARFTTSSTTTQLAWTERVRLWRKTFLKACLEHTPHKHLPKTSRTMTTAKALRYLMQSLKGNAGCDTIVLFPLFFFFFADSHNGTPHMEVSHTYGPRRECQASSALDVTNTRSLMWLNVLVAIMTHKTNLPFLRL